MSDSVGSVSVEVVPDARGWSTKLDAQIRDTTAKVKVDADTTEANAQLDEAARTRTAKIKTDTSQLSKGAKSLDDFVGKLGLLPALAITAGAALIPLAAAAGGLVAALGAPLAIAGGGATLFAFLGGLAVKETQDQLKNVDQLKKSVESARTSLENAQRSAGKNAATSASVANAQERLATATKAYQTALGGLSPAQKQFADSLGKLKGAFGGLLAGKNGQALLGPINTGMDLLSKLLPLVEPLLRSVSGAFSTLLGDLSSAAGGQGFKQFVDQVARLAAPDIVSLGHILGNIAGGVGGLVIQFNKHLSGSLLDDLDRFSGQFAHFGETAGKTHVLQSFFDYFHRVGPQVADTLGSVARALGHIVKALAPLGPPILHIVKGIADAISGIPVPVLTALAGGAAGLVAFQKLGGLKVTGFALNKLTGGSGLAGGLVGSVKPIPVFVTNPGFGGAGVPGGKGGGVLGDAEEAGKFGPLAIAGQAGLAALAALGVYEGVKHIAIPITKRWAQESAFPNVPMGGVANDPGAGQHLPLALNQPAVYRAWQMEHPNHQAGTALNSLHAQAASASRDLDMIGPHATAAASVANKAIESVSAHLAKIQDRKFTILVNAQAALRGLQAVYDAEQRLHDRTLNIYQRNVAIDQTGGRHVASPGGSGPGMGSHSGGGAGRASVHVHLDDSGRHTLSGFMDDNYRANRDADQDFHDMVAGR